MATEETVDNYPMEGFWRDGQPKLAIKVFINRNGQVTVMIKDVAEGHSDLSIRVSNLKLNGSALICASTCDHQTEGYEPQVVMCTLKLDIRNKVRGRFNQRPNDAVCEEDIANKP